MKSSSIPWKVLRTCARLARLAVTFSSCYAIEVHTTNVCVFSIAKLHGSFSVLHIDRDDFVLDSSTREQPIRCERDASSKWKVCRIVALRNHISSNDLKLIDSQPLNLMPSPPTRIQSFLSSNGTITFIQPSSKQGLPKNFKSLAFRLAHDLHVYHRLDSQIVELANELTNETELTWPDGNIVLIGTLSDPLIKYVLSQGKIPLAIQGDYLTLNGHNLNTNIHTGNLQLPCWSPSTRSDSRKRVDILTSSSNFA